MRGCSAPGEEIRRRGGWRRHEAIVGRDVIYRMLIYQ